MYVIPEYHILKESASVSLEREAEDFMCEAVEVVEDVPSIMLTVWDTQTRGRHSIASTSGCSFPVVAGGRFCIDTI